MPMLIVKLFEIELGSVNSWDEKDEASFLKSREKFEGFDLELCEFEASSSYQTFVKTSHPIVSDQDKIIRMMTAEIQVTIKREISTKVNIANELAAMADKPLKVSGGDQYNTHCDVHMPGQALSMYNDMLLLEDVCTDELQTALNKGWRIIAACPQADQRRPDYILGRYNPDRDVSDTAADREG